MSNGVFNFNFLALLLSETFLHSVAPVSLAIAHPAHLCYALDVESAY